MRKFVSAFALLIIHCTSVSYGEELLPLYRNNLKNQFLAASALPQNFCLRSHLASGNGRLLQTKNSEEPLCQNPDSSGYFGISLEDLMKDQEESNLAEEVQLEQREEAHPAQIECDLGSRPMQAGVRHSQGAGVGYTHGYTTLEGFFSPKYCYHEWTPFLDLRGHMFNNSRYAANAGIGLRYLSSAIAWGINSYYDYRNTEKFHYNQWGVGLEAIGPFWSVHVNGYLPVGKKRSDFFNLGLIGTPTSPSFAFFQGNQFFITLSGSQAVVGQQEFAFKGLDAKFSIRAVEVGPLTIDAGIGPYYFQGAYGKYAAGGEASLTARITEYVTLSVTGTYDNLFHQRAQGSVGISIPFGARSFRRSCSKPQPCKIPSFFASSLTRGADRSEIVVLDKHEKVLASAQPGTTQVAINPETGQPYFIWFVNNESSSDGTFESPFPTVQEALAVAQPNDIIYVYEGDGSPYDVAIALQDSQMLLGSGVSQNVLTTEGLIAIPPQSAGSPTLENTLGATMITVANENTVSGFHLSVLNAGDIVVGSGINSFSFENNAFTTAVTSGMSDLVLTNCVGALLVQNNQFTMNSGDTGSFGIVVSDAGSEASTLSVLNNTFTNHASRAMSLNYSGTSTPTLNIISNVFTPPAGAPGTNAIDITTSNGTVLASSLLNLNEFSDYTSNVINLNWAGTGNHTLTIAGNTISSDPTVLGTNGVLFSTNASGISSLTISGNQLLNQTSNGVNCFAGTNAVLAVAISGNTVTAIPESGGNGIQVNASDSAIVTGSITSNTCREHLAANISGFPSSSSQLSLTIANNTLIGPTNPTGFFPNGIQFSANNSAEMNFNINHNQITNHPQPGINLFSSDVATVVATIDSNTLSVPDTLAGSTGISISGSNSSAVTSTYIVTNNVCSGHSNGNIQSFPNNFSVLDLTISGNTLIGSTVSSNSQGIQISPSNFANVTALINGQNHLSGHTSQGINLFSSDTAEMTATIDGNILSAPVSSTNTSGISVGGNNSSAVPLNSYTITHNSCLGHNNGSIQCFPSGSIQCDLVISNNTLVAVTDGISGSSPIGIQVDLSNDANLVSATISGNSWTSPSTYQASGTPQGLSIGANNAATMSNVDISNNSFVFSLASYQTNTGPSGIQSYLNDTSTASGLTISENIITYATSTYADVTGPSGIQVSAQGSGVLTDVTILENTVSFAPLAAPLATFQASGISVNAIDTASVGTALSPVLVEQNTILLVEGNGIILLEVSSNNAYVNAVNNFVSLGAVMNNGIGIVTVPIGSGIGLLVTDINGNTVDGNHGGFAGIVATNQSDINQRVTIQNNTVTNIYATNPLVPIPGVGGGAGAVILGSGDLNVCFLNNNMGGNFPQAMFGIGSELLGGTGTLCTKFQGNQGTGLPALNRYALFNQAGAASTFIYQNGGGNTGTFTFNPSSSDFTPGTCSCP
ncbi:MAG: inverse autotransporter beta domain-containing protein [Chlamydiales bacterium]|nr:inverse autotransporter beta domain-containing protein [Chlamydiales bacterium]